MPKISGTRVASGDEAGGSKNMRTGVQSSGGPVVSPRAQKPVKGVTNANTVDQSMAEKVTRPTSGSRK